jgi:glycosyltransferase involved in cell wall biosynthesis
MKVAIVTPYYKEPDAILQRCIQSVLAQTHQDTWLYLVSDGFPKLDLTSGLRNVLTINLPVAHGDYGCTPRSVGAVCALNEGADVVCFLDADNWYEPNHVSSLVNVYEQAARQGDVLDAAFAYRHIFLPGHEHLRLEDAEDMQHTHVDTSCLSFARSAAFMWPIWGMIPKAWTPACDRVMFDLLKAHQLKGAWTGLHTVLYESNWSGHYRQAGLPVPTTGLHDDTLKNIARPSAEEIFSRLRVK